MISCIEDKKNKKLLMYEKYCIVAAFLLTGRKPTGQR
jgi:hypothetical protein